MVEVKLEAGKKRYNQAADFVPDRYKDGISAAKWKERAQSDDAEKAFEAKMKLVLEKKRRQKAVAKCDEMDWKNPALNIGPGRIKEGMKEKGDKWAKEFEPYAEALKGVSLPAKSADPMENIDKRLKPIVQALVKKKEELLG